MSNKVLTDFICLDVAKHGERQGTILFVNANNEVVDSALTYIGNICIFTSPNRRTRHITMCDPVMAAQEINHKYVVCWELANLDTVEAVLDQSEARGVRKAMIIGIYNFKCEDAISLRHKWKIRPSLIGINAYTCDLKQHV